MLAPPPKVWPTGLANYARRVISVFSSARESQRDLDRSGPDNLLPPLPPASYMALSGPTPWPVR